MKFGVCVPNYGESSNRDAIVSIATEAENLGYDSLWTTDHILMQKNSGTPYERIYESITTLSYLSAMTKKIKLGISSLIIAMRNPLVAAKQIATVDNLSNGRVMLAVGAGWNEIEFSFTGSNFHDRGKRLDDSIRLIRALWEGKSNFKGRYIDQWFDSSVFEPKPISKLKIWVGGVSVSAMRRAIKLGDAWHPNAYPIDQFKKMVMQFYSLAGNRKEIAVRIGINMRSEEAEYIGPRGERRLALVRNERKNRELIEELSSMGIGYLVVAPNHDGKVAKEEQIEAIRLVSKLF